MDALQSTEPQTRELPRTLGRYELLHELASGGMAAVYLARTRGAVGDAAGTFVAIKCCHAHLQREQEFAEMFLDEARLASRIHHPNVVPTLAVGPSDAHAPLYMAMEFVDGFSLAQLVRAAAARALAVPTDVALRIVLDALAGLHAAHELRDDAGGPMNLVHRDVSPHNVLVGTDGVARIMDFGIAKAESRLSHTREGTVKGKLGYMAPEQHGLGVAEGTTLPPVTRQADVYSAGIVLWELLTAQRLFHGETDARTLRLVLRSVPRKPSDARPGAPAALDAVVMRALARAPMLRYRTADEFAAAISATGVRPADSQAVGAFVEAAMADEVGTRRALLEALRAVARASADASQRTRRAGSADATGARPRLASEPARAAPPLPSAGRAEARPELVQFAVVETTDPSINMVAVPSPATLAPPDARTRARPWLFPAAIVALLLAAAGIALGARLTTRSHPPVAPAPVATVIAPRAAPSPRVAVVLAAPPPPPAPVLEPRVVIAPAPEALRIAAPPVEHAAHRSHGPSRPRPAPYRPNFL